jgi:hypothetical protein
MRTFRTLALCVSALFLIVPFTAQSVEQAAWVSVPFRCLDPAAESDTVAQSAAWADTLVPPGSYLWSWTIECAASDDYDGLEYSFMPAGLDSTYIVNDEIDQGGWYTWDCGIQWLIIRGVGGTAKYRVRWHQD